MVGRWAAGIGATVLIGLTVTACSSQPIDYAKAGSNVPARSGASTSTTAAPTTTSVPLPTQAQLQAKLLSLSQMPAGFVATSLGNTSGASSCVSTGPVGNGGVEADEAFEGSALGPIVVEMLVVGRTAAETHAAFTALRQALPTCSKGAQVSPMSFPSLGTESYAVQVTLASSQGSPPLTLDLAVVRTGATLVLMGDGGLTGNPGQLQSLTRAAVAKAN
jgi:hypothetical protein